MESDRLDPHAGNHTVHPCDAPTRTAAATFQLHGPKRLYRFALGRSRVG
jgi:hypothetical protein